MGETGLHQATLHQLKVFEAVARHNSFTRAAEELFLTQPTVSMQVKQLTKAVGLPLFDQVGKRLYLTEAGQQLLLASREIFGKIDQLEMTVADMKGLKRGRLRLAVITTAKYFVPRLLGPFCQKYPGIDISLQVTNHRGITDRLGENLDDLYIVSQLPEGLNLSYHPVLENPLIVLAPAKHHLANQRNIPIELLANEPFIMREPGSGTRKSVQELLDRHGVTVKVRLELGSNEAIKQAIAGGLGISVLSRHTLALEGAMNQLTILDIQGFPIQNQWYVIYPKGKQLSVVAQTFFEYLLQEAEGIAKQINLPLYPESLAAFQSSESLESSELLEL